MTGRTWEDRLMGRYQAMQTPGQKQAMDHVMAQDFTQVASADLLDDPFDVMAKVRDHEAKALDQAFVSLMALAGVPFTALELVHWGSLADDRGQWSGLRVHGWTVFVVRTRWAPGGHAINVEAGWLMYPPPGGPGDEEARRLWNEALYEV